MNYEEMSDECISERVAKIRYPDNVIYMQFGRVRVQIADGDDFYFDINNVSDAWPIIVENGISLIRLPSGWQAVSKWDYIDLSDFDDINECCIGHSIPTYGHQKPFRAAMICFLMMQEAK